jgi:hypothetical protein
VSDFVCVPVSAVDWLKKHYPALCAKSGLCESVGGRLYTKTTIRCATEVGHCQRRPVCKDACDLRVQPAFIEGKRAGWEECVAEWAKHMERVALAIGDGMPDPRLEASESRPSEPTESPRKEFR